ncbi:uncharacterized protein GGS25DRAFT_315618 [Hypoxylon fragiforme]|uniref:uncharacterized protein n=1 Tax=Hypoxylon fragiforme TaxID=63214 RepID=UPI0020C6AB1B|nr:uncharacterized protein GGS25DRAFT_315618 [Hypoxylon fragiforme]KAI2606998.1 hypothetical protein GGS25DRAFT_315618 [Hypoxylon fragiforme]
MAAQYCTAPFPAELWHLVCENLTPHEARSLRLTCRVLANIAACHGFQRIVIHPYSPDFEMLQTFSENPFISRNIKLLVYQVYTLIYPENWNVSLSRYLSATESKVLRSQVQKCRQNFLPAGIWDKGFISMDDIRENYHQYCCTVRFQRQLWAGNAESDFFESVIPRLTALEHVVVNVNSDCSWPSPLDAFFVTKHNILKTDGEGHLGAMMNGLRASNIRLHSLGGIGLESFVISPEFLHTIATTQENLKDVCLRFGTWAECNAGKMREQARSRAIANFLKMLPDLENLSVSFTRPDPRISSSSKLVFPAKLHEIIPRGFRWKKLRRVHFQCIEADKNDLLTFYEIHKSTLLSLHVGDMKLRGSSWGMLFDAMYSLIGPRFSLHGLNFGVHNDPGKANFGKREEIVGRGDGGSQKYLPLYNQALDCCEIAGLSPATFSPKIAPPRCSVVPNYNPYSDILDSSILRT